ELLSTGGTARALRDAGLEVTDVSDVTGFPEILGGRVKTLHPKIHGGLLALRDDDEHAAAMDEHGIGGIDLLCVNLYPFERTVAREGVTRGEAIEQIDIGGPAMIRAAAKNHAHVAVVTDPSQYERVAGELEANDGATTLALREELAFAAFSRTAAYDAAISGYLAGEPVDLQGDPTLPGALSLGVRRTMELRYGENPHQPAAAYVGPGVDGPSVLRAEQLHGKALSYNNLLDGAAALELVAQLAAMLRGRGSDESAACVVKHTNPCGASVAPSVADAVSAAIAGDPMAAFGGILAVSSALGEEAASIIADPSRFFEVLVAPSFEPGAVEILAERWKNVRLLAVGDLGAGWREDSVELRGTIDAILAQRRDRRMPDPASWELAAGPEPGEDVRRDAAALELVVRALSSNSILLGGREGGSVRLFGAGAGQMDRVASCRLAIEKAGASAEGTIAVSDAFFPFPDGPELLIRAGARVLVHPGGSKRDGETFELCEKHGVACLITGVRRFRH
ncbi:MAG: bifunctional phosphoribosylaminoimidazolecarboxamide formyltransferase/IMP cyclohydrolase, partial [Planctomycetota bacterium]